VITLSPARALVAPSLRWVNRAATVLLVLAAAALGTLLAGRAVGVRPFVERSGSMGPAIAAGDLLISHLVGAGAVRRGDIVTFPDALRPGTTTTHRVVALRRAGGRLLVTTRGDANPVGERWSTPAAGRVRRVEMTIPKAGTIVAALDGRWARVALLLFACLGLAAAALHWIWRE
jgi:signal peptidase I